MNFDTPLEDLTAMMEAEGQDPDIVLPLYDLLAESAALGVQGKADGDAIMATIGYGRVSAIFDVLLALDIPVPADSPAEIMAAAEAVLLGTADGDEEVTA